MQMNFKNQITIRIQPNQIHHLIHIQSDTIKIPNSPVKTIKNKILMNMKNKDK